MNYPLVLQRTLLLVGLVWSAIAASQFPAKAESASTAPTPETAQSVPATNPPATATPEALTNQPAVPDSKLDVSATDVSDLQDTQPRSSQDAPSVPVPGTASTSAAEFFSQAPVEPPPPVLPTDPNAVETRYKFSYIGFGVNFGTGSDTALGSISFAAISKFALSPYFSFRPSVLVSDDASFLLPFTYDFPNRGPGNISPYVGVGPIFSTGDGDNVDLLLTAGLDYPLNPQVGVTASVNVAPINDFDIGFILGLVYTFSTETVTTPVVNLSQAIPKLPPRPNPSYLGVGVNLGAGGDTALGDVSAAIYSKIALNSYLSFRPAVLISEDATFLLPVTYDFNAIRLSQYIRLFPYLGVGASFSTGEDSNADLLLTGGVDFPITPQFTGTVGVNVGPLDSFDIGFLLGFAYTFGEFER